MRPPFSRRSAFLAGACAAVATAGIATATSRKRAARRVAAAAERARAAADRRAAASSAASRALARSLADDERSTLLAFYTPDCALCARMVAPLSDVAEREKHWLDVVPVDADDGASWALETLRYDVSHVPSYVILDRKGRALGKSGRRPADVEEAGRAVSRLVGAARPKGKRGKAKEVEEANEEGGIKVA